jgi:hypothetical protein
MTEIESGADVSADGEYVFAGVVPDGEMPVEFDGDLGGGTITLGIQGLRGGFVPIKNLEGEDVTLDSSGQFAVFSPISGKVAFKLEGATDPDFAAGCSGV